MVESESESEFFEIPRAQIREHIAVHVLLEQCLGVCLFPKSLVSPLTKLATSAGVHCFHDTLDVAALGQSWRRCTGVRSSSTACSPAERCRIRPSYVSKTSQCSSASSSESSMAAAYTISVRPCAARLLKQTDCFPTVCVFITAVPITVLRVTPNFGLWSMVLPEYVGIRRALSVVIRMLAAQVGASQRSPSLPSYPKCLFFNPESVTTVTIRGLLMP